jgi:hypothetical protein
MMTVEQQKAKQDWAKPVLKVYGAVEEVTQQATVTKTVGAFDGVIFDPDLGGPIPGVPIGNPS